MYVLVLRGWKCIDRSNAVDAPSCVVGNEEAPLQTDRDTGGACHTRYAITQLKSAEEFGPLCGGIIPIDRRARSVAVHRHENNVRFREIAPIELMPRAMCGYEEPTAIGRPKRVGAGLRLRIECGTDNRRVCRKLDARGNGVGTISSRFIRDMILFAGRPPVIRHSLMR